MLLASVIWRLCNSSSHYSANVQRKRILSFSHCYCCVTISRTSWWDDYHFIVRSPDFASRSDGSRLRIVALISGIHFRFCSRSIDPLPFRFVGQSTSRSSIHPCLMYYATTSSGVAAANRCIDSLFLNLWNVKFLFLYFLFIA